MRIKLNKLMLTYSNDFLFLSTRITPPVRYYSMCKKKNQKILISIFNLFFIINFLNILTNTFYRKCEILNVSTNI